MRCSSPCIRIQQVISVPVSAEMAPSEEIVENLCYKGCRGGRSYGSPSGRAGMLSYIHSPLWSTAWFSGKPPWDVQLSFPLLFCVLTTSGDTYFVFWFFFFRLWARGMRSKYPQTRFGDRARIHTYSTGFESSLAFCLFRTFSEPKSAIQIFHWLPDLKTFGPVFGEVFEYKIQQCLCLYENRVHSQMLFCLMPAESVTLLPAKVNDRILKHSRRTSYDHVTL